MYAIGDIHGRLDLMSQLLEQITKDAARHPGDLERKLVFLGDYVDRGPESRGVVEVLRSRPLPGFTSVFLLGNHEEAMLDFLDGRSDGMGWLSYGGLETLALLRRSASRPAHQRGVSRRTAGSVAGRGSGRTCRFHAQLHAQSLRGRLRFCPCRRPTGKTLAMQQRNDLLWIREDFLRATSPLPGKVVVHGHTICDVPQDLGYRIDIDTGAFVSGRLTCLILRNQSRRFLATGGP